MKGRVWKFGDDVDTDAVIPGRYLVMNTPEELAPYTFVGVRPEFAGNVKENDIVVAGNNFGCGSSREHAPIALKGSKIGCVIAKSFARIFFRNAINIGVALLECPETDKIDDGDELTVDIASGIIENITKGEKYKATPLPDFVRGIVDAGGLKEYTRQIIN
ncbi:3-isopropylmalate dehydratase small subunit [Methanococcoides alaskense]|uniref:3-isopropylmalate dehydratase small subunit n=1 Tax=Methanococcoides alaskense TaxID=325778 RepID=A0AA90ZCW5_9EURY|nr:3-isopropylmalate dehydratase small subunit [Methanococcoides alaskense]MDA0524819.1 3-isopropylmalate dehydratase small subunit [Methanococcoides alaskense]MDR6223057.1 3-isopropylmalate/(R)-2-methylmalate dehydratase small subunit [Methanococcoides alaskense]